MTTDKTDYDRLRPENQYEFDITGIDNENTTIDVAPTTPKNADFDLIITTPCVFADVPAKYVTMFKCTQITAYRNEIRFVSHVYARIKRILPKYARRPGFT